MKKRRIIGCAVATAIIATTFTGCSLVSSNANADMAQIIAEVNISKVEKFAESGLEDYKSAVGTTYIVKRELVAFFLNAGYSYVQSGMSYSQVFTSLMDSLVDNAVLTQYATMYVLKDKDENTSENALETFNNKETDIERYEYLLGEDGEDVKIAKYSLYSALNTAIDSYESNILDNEDATSGSGTRATPGGVDTEKEDYYPDDNGALDYGVYTGYSGRDYKTKEAYSYLIADSGAYKDDMLTGSTKSTRTKAYVQFMSTLINNNLVDPVSENINNVLSLRYIQDQYVTQLKQRVIEKYYDLYEAEQEKLLTEGKTEEAYSYVKAVYDSLLKSQTDDYEEAVDFSSVMGNFSDTSFLLYSPKSAAGEDGKAEFGGTFGYVYNILLPFSAEQNALLKNYQAQYVDSDDSYTVEYYNKRNELLKDIVTVDQRADWLNGETDYGFTATAATSYYNGGNSARNILFFENNLTKTDRYDSLEKYVGEYSFNGTVVRNKEDDGYNIKYNYLNINDMLEEFANYINYVLGTTDSVSMSKQPSNSYYSALTENTLYKNKEEKEIDYSNFLYASGKVNFGEGTGETYNRLNMLARADDEYFASNQYKVTSAVNELQYAYTTDTGVLSQYLGYSVNLGGDTGYIKEFEYACHQALANGAGSFAVCAGDYGWHLLYVTFAFDNTVGGEQYKPEWTPERINHKGTFENLFYEWVKSVSMDDASSTRRNWIVNKFNKESTVTVYQNRYQDLLDLDS